MKFFILVFIPLVLMICLAGAGWMIFEVMGALAGGVSGLILLILGVVIFVKDRRSDGASPAGSMANRPYEKKMDDHSAPAPAKQKYEKIKIKKSSKRDQKAKGILQNAQVLLKDVSYDVGRQCVLIDATIVPTTENGAFLPWYPDELSFVGFVSESSAQGGQGGQKFSALEWKRWVQTEFKPIDQDELRGSCRLQFAIPLPQPGDVRFFRFHYQNECFGHPIALPPGIGANVVAESPEEMTDIPADPMSPSEQDSQSVTDETFVPPADDTGAIPVEAMTDEEGNPLIYVLRNGEQEGPYSISDLWVEVAEGRLYLTDQAWHEGLENWVSLASLIENK